MTVLDAWPAASAMALASSLSVSGGSGILLRSRSGLPFLSILNMRLMSTIAAFFCFVDIVAMAARISRLNASARPAYIWRISRMGAPFHGRRTMKICPSICWACASEGVSTVERPTSPNGMIVSGEGFTSGSVV